ncbi:hypothetical protein REPUB_Repub13aG0067200 [Reevesia pubescens]
MVMHGEMSIRNLSGISMDKELEYGEQERDKDKEDWTTIMDFDLNNKNRSGEFCNTMSDPIFPMLEKVVPIIDNKSGSLLSCYDHFDCIFGNYVDLADKLKDSYSRNIDQELLNLCEDWDVFNGMAQDKLDSCIFLYEEEWVDMTEMERRKMDVFTEEKVELMDAYEENCFGNKYVVEMPAEEDGCSDHHDNLAVVLEAVSEDRQLIPGFRNLKIKRESRESGVCFGMDLRCKARMIESQKGYKKVLKDGLWEVKGLK